MLRRLALGLLICLVGVTVSMAIAVSLALSRTAAADAGAAALRESVTSLSSDVKRLPSNVSNKAIDAIGVKLQGAQARGEHLQSEINNVRSSIQRVPTVIPGGAFGGGSTWGKDAALQSVDGLQRDLREIRTQTTDAVASINLVSASMLDMQRRITNLDARLDAEMKRLDGQSEALSSSQKVLATLWLPLALAIATVVGGISTIWLGWRKDIRETEELRRKYPDSGAAKSSELGTEADTPTG